MIPHSLKVVWNRKRANALIVAEIFVSFLVIFAVVTGAVAMTTRWQTGVGFEWRNVWTVSMDFDAGAREEGGSEFHPAVHRMLREAGAFAEVEAAAVSNTPPYAFSAWEMALNHEGREVTLVVDEVTDGFAKVMALDVVRGRWFNAEDDAEQHEPLVIDTTAARALFGTENPIGKKVEIDRDVYGRIVGVTAAYRKDGENSAPKNMMFRRIAPNGAYGRMGGNLVIRVRPGTSVMFEETLARRLQQIVPTLSLRVRQMEQMRKTAHRMQLAPLIAGGTIGLFLISMVALGLTGVLWQNVTRRTREIGVRRAMGATASSVHRQILVEVALLTTLAAILGMIVVLQLPLLGVMSFVTPAAFAVGSAGALAAIYSLTVLCALYPSWLASRLTPADALRYE